VYVAGVARLRSSRGKRLEELLKRAEAKTVEQQEELQVANAEIERLTRTRKALELELENAKERDSFNETARQNMQAVRALVGPVWWVRPWCG